MCILLASLLQTGIILSGCLFTSDEVRGPTFKFLADQTAPPGGQGSGKWTAARFLPETERFAPTFHDLTNSCDEVFEMKCLSVAEADANGLVPMECTVVAVHRTRQNGAQKGQAVRLSDFSGCQVGAHYLVIANARSNPAAARILIRLDEHCRKYIDAACSFHRVAEEADPVRLIALLPFFEDPDEHIARDALREITRASHSEWSNVEHTEFRSRLIERLKNPEFQSEYVGVYAALLGELGELDNLAVLEGRIFPPAQPSKGLSRAGLFAGYLLLGGETALSRLEHDIRDALTVQLEDREVTMPYSELDFFVKAIDYVWQRDVSPNWRKRLDEAISPLLKRTDVADVIIEQLRRHKDWSRHQQVCNVVRDSPNCPRITQLAVTKYLIELRKERQRLPKQEADAVEVSLQLLKTIEASDRKLYLDAERRLKSEQADRM